MCVCVTGTRETFAVLIVAERDDLVHRGNEEENGRAGVMQQRHFRISHKETHNLELEKCMATEKKKTGIHKLIYKSTLHAHGGWTICMRDGLTSGNQQVLGRVWARESNKIELLYSNF